MPDGRGIVFSADRGGAPHLFRKDLATGVENQLIPPGRMQEPAGEPRVQRTGPGAGNRRERPGVGVHAGGPASGRRGLGVDELEVPEFIPNS